MATREFSIGARPQAEWGWLVILDFFLGGTGAGLFTFSLVLGSPFGMTVGVLLVLVGAGLLLGDLNRPLGAWRVICRPRSSWLSRGSIGILAFTVMALVHIAYLVSRPGGGFMLSNIWGRGPAWDQVAAALAGVVAIFVALYPGFLLGGMRAIPLWNNVLSPLLFLSSSLLAGLGLAFLLSHNVGRSMTLSVLLASGAGLVLLEAVALLSLFLTSQTQVAKASVQRLAADRLKVQFYVGVLLLGMAIPLWLLISLLTSANVSAALLIGSGVLLLAGQFFVRYVLVRAGMYVSSV